MPRGSTKRISKRLIDTLKPRAKPYEARDGKLKGFLLRVQPTGRFTYYCEYDRGKRKKIGSTELFTPTEARNQALQILADHNPTKSPASPPTNPPPTPTAEPAPEPSPASLTLEQFLNDEYQPWAEANLKWGTGTVNRVRVLFCPELGNKFLHELTPWLLEKWCISRKKRSKVSASTISRDLATLSSVLSKAVQWGLIEKNPVKGVKASKAKSQEKTRYLTKEEEAAMRAAMDSREQRISKRPANSGIDAIVLGRLV